MKNGVVSAGSSRWLVRIIHLEGVVFTEVAIVKDKKELCAVLCGVGGLRFVQCPLKIGSRHQYVPGASEEYLGGSTKGHPLSVCYRKYYRYQKIKECFRTIVAR
jgi:hypothetical protein